MPTKTTTKQGKAKDLDITTLTSPQFAQEAFEKVKPQLTAMRAEDVLQVNADIPMAASIALGAYGRMAELRPLIVAELPRHPIELMDELPTYAAAAWYAHLISLPPSGSGERLKKLLDEAAPLRDALLLAAEALAPRGLLDADKVAEIRSGLGNLDRANDLAALADLFRQAWPQIASKTAVDRAEVDRAASLGMELLVALGEKGLGERRASGPEARELRARAFTLLIKAYEQCARAVAYLRWQDDDVETYAPSLRPKRAGRPESPPVPTPVAQPSDGPTRTNEAPADAE
jgi:hypothetical protein